MQFSQTSPVLLDSQDYDKKENSKRHNALRVVNIEKIVLSKCKSTHDIYKCNGRCSYEFCNPEAAIDSITKLRQKIWNSNNKSLSRNSTGRNIRNSVVLGELLAMRYKDDNGVYQIRFAINGIQVCKHFYFKSTGLSKKLLNSVYNYVTNKTCTKNDDYYDKLMQTSMLSIYSSDLESIIKNRPSKKLNIKASSLKDNVLAFLDVQFANGIDFAPENNVDRYTHLTWNELHSKYRSNCCQLCISAADYSSFCKIR